MKPLHLTIVLTLLLHSFIYKAQYIPFPESNALWVVSWGTSYQSSMYHYELTGDTLLGLTNYHKLESAGKVSYNFAPNDPQFYNAGYVGAYRNDTLAKKVFYIPKDSVTEMLLYDFNLAVGDTVRGYMEQIAKDKFGPTFFAVIDSVDSVLVNGSFRKRWHFHSSVWLPGSIIEGIGSTYGLLESLIPRFDDNGQLYCYSQDGISLYGGSCLLVTDIEKKIAVENDVMIYPNPIVNAKSITINTSRNKNIKFEVYSLLGKRCYPNFKKNKNEFIVETSSLPNSTYLFLIKKEEIVTQKIIVLKQIK